MTMVHLWWPWTAWRRRRGNESRPKECEKSEPWWSIYLIRKQTNDIITNIVIYIYCIKMEDNSCFQNILDCRWWRQMLAREQRKQNCYHYYFCFFLESIKEYVCGRLNFVLVVQYTYCLIALTEMLRRNNKNETVWWIET